MGGLHRIGKGYREGLLTWHPPALVDPLTIKLKNTTQGRRAIMDPARDYVIDATGVVVTVDDGIEINGGRNVRLVGAAVHYADDLGTDHGTRRRVLFIKGNAGQSQPRTVHVEGVRSSGFPREGINVDAQGETGLTVQLQNMNFADELLGSFEGNHSDFFQCWNGPTNVRMDRVYAKIGYQALMLQPHQYGSQPLGVYELRRCFFDGTERSGAMFYLVTGQPSDRPQIVTREVFLRPNPTKAYPAQVLLKDPSFWGNGVRLAPAGMRSFVSSLPGASYRSPGYE